MRAPFTPTVSISHAAFIVSRRACSISMRDSGDLGLDRALVGERLAERDALLRALAHQPQRLLGHADGAHAVVDPARAEPGLREREPAALLAEEVVGRDAHVVEQGLAVPAAGVVAEHGQRALDR